MSVNIYNTDNEDIINRLGSTFKPIELDQAFLEDLKEKLSRQPLIILETRPKTYASMVIVLGLVIGFFILWIIKK